MNRQTLHPFTEHALVFILGAGIFLSKPVIYIATGLLTLYFLIRLASDPAYRRDVIGNKLIVMALAIYAFGILAGLIMHISTEDLALIARKSLYLVIFAPLLLAFRSATSRSFALTGALIGFWIAGILTLASIPNAGISRIAGATWLVDVWGVLCGFLVVFLTPFVFDKRWSTYWRPFFAVTVLLAFLLLILSGARGPWLGAAAALFVYLLLFQKKTLGLLIVIAALAYFPAKHLYPTQINHITERAMSVTQTQTVASNWIRLTLWQLSIGHAREKASVAPGGLLLGPGSAAHFPEFVEFTERTSLLNDEEKKRLASYGYPSNDIHNMYLDSIAKHGLIWTLANLLFFLSVAFVAWRHRMPPNQTPLAAPMVILYFLITGITYTLLPHFATTFMIFFAVLGCTSNQREGNNDAGSFKNQFST